MSSKGIFRLGNWCFILSNPIKMVKTTPTLPKMDPTKFPEIAQALKIGTFDSDTIQVKEGLERHTFDMKTMKEKEFRYLVDNLMLDLF